MNQRTISSCALFGVLAGGLSTPVGAQVRVPFPMDVTAREGLLGTVELASRSADLAALVGLERVILTGLPLTATRTVELALERVQFDFGAIGLQVDGRPVAGGVDAGDLTLWKGAIVGAAESEVYLGLGTHGSHGWIHDGTELFHVLGAAGPNGDWSRSIARIVPEATLLAVGPGRGPFCAVDSLGGGPGTGAGAVAIGPPTTHALGGPGVTLHCPMAIETDYQLFQVFGSLAAEQNYVLTLLGAISDRYLDEIDTVLTFPYLAFYTTSGDPWTTQDSGGGTVDLLFEFRDAWANDIPAGAKLAHFVSGASLGGGVAWVDVLCNGLYGFAVSANIGGGVSFPVTQGSNTWDFMVIAHETGHNFGTSHTHNYCPPLDECPAAQYWGPCQDERICISNGTIMSYCHTCSGGMNNITTYFHPTVKGVMRAAAENSCLQPYCGITRTCTAKLNSAGCMPAIDWTGTPSLTGSDDFFVTATDVINGQFGFLLWSLGPNELPFFGGTLCVAPPLMRTSVQYAGGNSSGNDCSGAFSYHLTQAYLSAAGFSGGDEIHLQYWYRDPFLIDLVGLTDALSVLLCP